MQQESDIIERVRRGDFTGLNLVGLARLSFEINPARIKGRKDRPLTGEDINNRETQERRMRDYVESRGGRYVGTFDEPDTSAWKRKRMRQPDGRIKYRVIRPVYQDYLEDLKQGRATSPHFVPAPGFTHGVEIHGGTVKDIDRLTRDSIDLEDAINAVVYHTRPIVDIYGTLDLLTDNGRDMARQLVIMKGRQSADTSRRGKDSHYDRALEGIPVGGNRPFGWKEDKRTRDPYEAELKLQAAKDLIAGAKRPYTICRQWYEAGVRSPKGNPITKKAFTEMMVNPRNAGFRVYGPKSTPLPDRYIRDADGKPVRGQYEAILDEDTWRQVVAILVGEGRPEGHAYGGKLKYPCSGKIRCGNCGNKLRGQAKENGRHDYACKPPTVDMGCGKVCGSGVAIDALVGALVTAYLAEGKVVRETMPWAGAAELVEVSGKKTDLLTQFKANPDMGNYIWPEIRKLDTRITELTKERTAHNRKAQSPRVANILEIWDDLDADQLRAVYDEVIEVIVLQPARRGSNRFDPNRLSVVFRQE